MKFLCVACDEAMQLKRTMGPDEGSLSVVFGCPSCGRETAMMTNVMETQMVRSLGVKIGGRSVPAEPMETIRNSLANAHEQAHTGETSAHGAFVPEATSHTTAPAEGTASKCPFTGIVSEAFANSDEEISWTKEAEERIARVPSFAQVMVRKGVEMHARENGLSEIDEAVIDQVKVRFGM